MNKLALGLFMLLGACETIEGVGKDLKYFGNALEQEAQKSKIRTQTSNTPNPKEERLAPAYTVDVPEDKQIESVPYEKY